LSVHPAIVTEPAAITPEWMTSVLRCAGHEVTVCALAGEPVGTGQMAHNERYRITYTGDALGAPDSVVMKFPSPNDQSRAAGAQGGYRSEVRFYTELRSGLSISTPECLYGSVSEDSTVFTLVLEDLAPAHQGDQLAGVDDDQVILAAANLAGLHAPRWDDPGLDDIDWLESSGAGAISFVGLFTPVFIERYRHRLSEQARMVFETFGANVTRWVEAESPVHTLVHGDYRLDNLMFATSEGGAPVTVVDWQTLGHGAGGRDLAYLLGNSTEPRHRRRHESEAIGAYLTAMRQLGVDLSTNEAMRQYRHGMFQGPLITMLGSIAVGRTDRGDDMFMAMAERSAAQIIDHDALDLISG